MDIIVGLLNITFLYFWNVGHLELIKFGHLSNIGYLQREHSSRQVLLKILGISATMSFGAWYGYIRLNSQGEPEKDCGGQSGTKVEWERSKLKVM